MAESGSLARTLCLGLGLGLALGLGWLRLGFERFLPNAYFDLLGLGFRFLGQTDLENALFVVGLYILAVHYGRQRERPEKAPVSALDAVEVLFLLFFFELALTAHRQS